MSTLMGWIKVLAFLGMLLIHMSEASMGIFTILVIPLFLTFIRVWGKE